MLLGKGVDRCNNTLQNYLIFQIYKMYFIRNKTNHTLQKKVSAELIRRNFLIFN